jgi:hypothetical protein
VQIVERDTPTKTAPGEQALSGRGPCTRQPLARVRGPSSLLRNGAADELGAAGAAFPADRQW